MTAGEQQRPRQRRGSQGPVARKRQAIMTLVVGLLLIFGHKHPRAATGDGGYAAPFLQLGLGARAVAMGGAFSAIADDGTAPLWNAAASAWLVKRQFSATYRKMFLDRSTGYVSILFPVRHEAAFGANWRFAGTDDIFGRDDVGDITEKIKNFENQFSVNFARRFTRALALGVNIKYLQQNLANINAFSVGFDLAAHFIPNRDLKLGKTVIYMRSLRIGLAVENLGLKYPWNSAEYYSRFGQLGSSVTDNVPVNYKAGISYRFKRTPALLAVDVEKNSRQRARSHFGTEYTAFRILALRAGVNRGDPTFGLGVRQPFRKAELGLDYAFVTRPVAGADPDHLLTLQIAF